MQILTVLTSQDKLGNASRKTGFWLAEFAAPYYAAPYYVFKEAGAEIVLASPKGWTAAARSEKQRADLSDRSHTPVRPEPSLITPCGQSASRASCPSLVSAEGLASGLNCGRVLKAGRRTDRSLMLVTALAPVIGYDKASRIAHYAIDHDLTLKQAALKLGFVTEEEFDRVVDPAKMVKPYVAAAG
jgi:hypothetical protein